jgi:spore maturation protein CgeB
MNIRGHEVLLLQRDAESHSVNNKLPSAACGRTDTYNSLKELKNRFSSAVREADFVMVGSGLQEGIAIGEWVTRTAQGATAFYDTDTCATIAGLKNGGSDSISAALIPRFQVYLSVTGGSALEYIEEQFDSPKALPLYRFADASLYFPEHREMKWDLGYAGDYADDRQPALDRLFLEAARHWQDGRFIVAGAQYPRSIRWSRNVKRVSHLAPTKHREFYNSQRFTLNVTPANKITSGCCPSVGLFEAAACGTPIISDSWPGIETFFKPDEEILISHSSDETLVYLEEISELDRRRIGYRARERVLSNHTARHRAAELENYILEIVNPVFA